MKIISILIVFMLLMGCSSEVTHIEKKAVEPPKEERTVLNETIYKVQGVDWLFGNWVNLCNASGGGCVVVDLHETGLRSTIKENLLVKVTEYKVTKGNRSWEEVEYEYVEGNN